MRLGGTPAKLICLLLAGAISAPAFYYYAPSDVTMGLWLKKPDAAMAVAGAFTLLIALRALCIFLFSRNEKWRATLITFLQLPFYLFIALAIAVNINGFFDDNARVSHWRTNLVYLRDAGVACIVGGVDDDQLTEGVKYADIVFVPKMHCDKMSNKIGVTPGNYPYWLKLSAGRLGIPYVVDISRIRIAPVIQE